MFKQHDCTFQSSAIGYDLSTESCISKSPLVPDPYEDLFVIVDDSLIADDAGEGLFAKVDIEPATVVSFYNGIRFKADDPSTASEDSGYKLTLNEDLDIDIPEGMSDINNYRASLAHKV
jgi:histone-lysine N-methyltransferase SETD7